MRLVSTDGIDPSTIAVRVRQRTFASGVVHAQLRGVRSMEWDPTDDVLYAEVRGLDGVGHQAVVEFDRGRRGLVFAGGECTCSVGVDCAHVVAAALVAAQGPARPPALPPEDAWARDLDALLEPTDAERAPVADVPIAIELSLRVVADRPTALSARLVQPGRSGWVAGGLAWGRVGGFYHAEEHRPEHVRLVRELYAMHQSGARYQSGEQRTIDLDGVDSPRLWSLLDEADAAGVRLVQTRKRLGDVEHRRVAELRLDVTAAGDGLQVAPVLHLDGGDPAEPLLFVGASGHGVVYRSGEGFGLARLAAPASAALRRMVLDRRPLAVPDGQQERFRAEFCPRLSRLAPLGSSDGAFDPPRALEPTLVLHTAFGDGHELALDWEWTYDVDEAVDLDAIRDPAAERAVLDRVRDLGLELPGLDGGGRVGLRGLDTMRFATEALPLLAGVPGLAVAQTGERPRYREAGESLEIGVSTRETAGGGNDWFDLGVRVSVEGREVPFRDLFVALAAGESHLLLPDGAYFSLDKPQLRALRALIEEARSLQDAPEGLRISRFQAGLWAELAALGVVDRQAAAWREQVTGLLELDALPGAEPPPTLTATLRPYQREGFEWLCFLRRHGLGGILADDMGLGKTLQTLAMVAHARLAEPGTAPFLVVAPTSVVGTWAAEARRFTPDLTVVTITDTLRRRGRELAEVVAGADLVITSYALFRLDIDAHLGVEWSGLVLDEAQFAKNHQSKVHGCARRLPAPFKLAITGTPMENNLMELWSLLSITAPGLFPDPAHFRDEYARPIEKTGTDADRAELLARLRRRIRPLVLRRTKEQVAPELPAKQEQVLEVELDPGHRRLYQRHLQRERQKVLGLLDDVDRNRFTILKSITLLRRLSLHPALVEPEQRHLGSAKIDVLLEQLGEVVAGGHRALVFSQFTGFLAEVRERLDTAGVAYTYLDGTSRDRPAIIRRFTEGTAPVFLISLKAGGFGLTLTEADYCFLLDPWWNPATEAQAVDRTHRIGQTRSVMVYRLIARDTIEEKVRALAQRKAALFTGVMDDGNAFGTALDADDIRALVS
jgi:superfamily II DNA or RNA helicase